MEVSTSTQVNFKEEDRDGHIILCIEESPNLPKAWYQIHGATCGISTSFDYVGRIDCHFYKNSCTPTSTKAKQPWVWACNQSLRHAFYVAPSHIQHVSHNKYFLAIEKNGCIVLFVLDMWCAFIHMWRFSFLGCAYHAIWGITYFGSVGERCVLIWFIEFYYDELQNISKKLWCRYENSNS